MPRRPVLESRAPVNRGLVPRNEASYPWWRTAFGPLRVFQPMWRGAEGLAFLLLKIKALRVLRLRGNAIQSRGAIALASVLIQRQFLVPRKPLRTLPFPLDELDLACNDIGDGAVTAVPTPSPPSCGLTASSEPSTYPTMPSPSPAHGACHPRWRRTGRWTACWWRGAARSSRS